MRTTMRTYHRYLGFFLAGIMAVYAISGIILVGGMLQLNGPPGSLMVILGASAILLATINIVGGFMVTQRMLRMFRR